MSCRISVSTLAFDGYDHSLALDEIAKLGVSFVEPAYIHGYLDFDESVFAEKAATKFEVSLKNSGLSVVAVSAHVDTGLPSAVEQLKRRIEFARCIGAEMVITMASTKLRETEFFSNIERILPFAEDSGITLSLENAGAGVGNLISDAHDAAGVMTRFRNPSLRVNYDFGNIVVCSAKRPETDFEAVLPWASHFHLKDVSVERQGWRFPAIGDGSIDFRTILGRLKSVAPGIPLGIETPLSIARPSRDRVIRSVVTLPEIREALGRSLHFVSSELSPETTPLAGGAIV